MNNWLYLLPVISALTGWIALWLAGRVFTDKILPLRKSSLAESISLKASAAFPVTGLTQKISNPDNIKNVMPVVEEHIDHFLRHKLKEKMPMIGMLIGDKTIQSLKEVFLKEIEDMFPQVMNRFTGNLASEFDVRALLAAKINAVTPTQFRQALRPVSTYYAWIGALVGFIIGLINLAIVIAL